MSNVDMKIKFDLTKLKNIQEELKKNYITKVGILGTKNNARGNSEGTNSFIGAVHEFGSITRNIPQRSFLKVPLTDKIPGKLKEIGQNFFDSITKENIRGNFKNLGIIAENIVQQAFSTKGFGKWKENIESTIKRKKSASPLIDTGELRKSITSKVETKRG